MPTTIDACRFTVNFNYGLKDTSGSAELRSEGNQNTGSEGTYASGTGAGKVNRVYIGRHDIAAGATLSLDLSGALLDPLKNPFVLTKLKGVYVKLFPTTGKASTRVLAAKTISNSVAPWNVPVTRNGTFLVLDPTADGLAAVTAATADIFAIENADGAAVADVFVCLIGEGS